MNKSWSVILAGAISFLGLVILLFWLYGFFETPLGKVVVPPIFKNQYPLHQNITATTFWVGEPADKSNKNISNAQSAWDENWQKHYGGVDNPNDRQGYFPAAFTPKENPFYFALPYNDFDSNGNRKKTAGSVIYWAAGSSFTPSQSMLKNKWIEITASGKTAYAQWEDVGPFGENDSAYVFGNATPKSKTNHNAGLDLSPAVEDYLNLTGEDKVDWRFIKAQDVPAGPWKKIITTSS